MSESRTLYYEVLAGRTTDGRNIYVADLLGEHAAALAQARADALEEVKAALVAEGHITNARALEVVASLQTTTPPASIPVAKAREVLRTTHVDWTTSEVQVLRDIAQRLGVPLDGGESRALKCPGCPCSVHETGDCPHRCEDV